MGQKSGYPVPHPSYGHIELLSLDCLCGELFQTIITHQSLDTFVIDIHPFFLDDYCDPTISIHWIFLNYWIDLNNDGQKSDNESEHYAETDFYNADSDGDGLSDGFEIAYLYFRTNAKIVSQSCSQSKVPLHRRCLGKS